jgi:hypothetical protein
MREHVDRLQRDGSHYEKIVQKCLETVEESTETNARQVKQITRLLGTMQRELNRLHENREERPEPPSPEIRRAKLYGGAFLERHIPDTITESLPSFRTFDEQNNVSETLQYFPGRLPYQPGGSFYRADTAVIRT